MPNKYIPLPPKGVSKTPTATPITEDVGMPWKAAGLLTRLAGGAASGTVGVVPSPFTTPTAMAIGGLAEALAQKLETPSGTPIDLKRISLESALSGVPLGKIYKGGQLLANMVRGAGLAEVGNVGRRKAATGNYLPQTGKEALWDVGSMGLGSAFGIIPGMRGAQTLETIKPPVIYEIETTAHPGGTVLSGGKTTYNKGGNPSVSNAKLSIVNKLKPILASDTHIGVEPRPDVATAYGRIPVVGTPAEASGRVQKVITKLSKEKTAQEKIDAKNLADTEKWLAKTRADKIAKDNAAAQQLEMDTRKAGLTPMTGPVKETIKGHGPNNETQTSTTTYAEEKPSDVVGEGGADTGPIKPAPLQVSHLSMGDAKKEFRRLNLDPEKYTIDNPSKNLFRIIERGAAKAPEVPNAVSAQELADLGLGPKNPPNLPSEPPTASMEKPAEMAPSLDRDVISTKKYTNKAEAAAIAKATGGEVYQQGPRHYKVRFAAEPQASLIEEPLAPLTEPVAPPTPFKPSTPIVSEPVPVSTRSGGKPVGPLTQQNSGLTPDEFKRYMDLRPGQGTNLSPAELGEYRALHDRIFAGPSEETPLSIEEFAQALDKEGQRPIAKVPFPQGKIPTGATPPAEVQGNLTGEPSAVNKAPEGLFDRVVANPASEPPASPLAAPVEPPVTEGGAAPIRFFKSPVEAAGQGYGDIKAAKTAGEVVPEAGRSVAGRAAQRLNREAKAVAPTPEAQPVPEAVSIEPDSSQLIKLPKEQQEKALFDIVKRVKGVKGAIDPVLFARMGLSATGAAAGAATTPDDPMTGALLGGTAGFYAPSVVRALIGHASNNPNIGENALSVIAKKAEDTVISAFHLLPDYQRASLLSNPINLMTNMWVGPWGSAIMFAIEHALQRDSRAFPALKALLFTTKFSRGWKNSLAEAGQIIENVNERTEGVMGKEGPAWFRFTSKLPGEAMTAGDLSARNILMEAGFTAEDARRATLTSEPYMPFGRGISAFKKGAQSKGGKKSFIINMMLPFYRTNTNQLEQSLERTPFIGALAQRYWKDTPDPLKAQIAQQIAGGGVGAASFLLGTVVPPEDVKYMRKFVNNFGGQYGAIASAALVAGIAYGGDKSMLKAVGQDVAQRDMPLPSTQPLQDLFNIAKAFNGEQDFKVPSSLIPGIFNPDVPGSIGGLAVGLANTANLGASGITRSPNTNYTPLPPKK